MVISFTLSQYRTWTLNRLDDASFDSSKLTQFANDTNREICNTYEWPFMKTATSPTSTSTATNSYPSDLQVPINLTLTAPSGKEVYLPPKSYEWYDQQYPDPSTLTAATPEFWVPWGATFILGPAALDQAYTYVLRYIKEPTTASADASTLNVPDAFSELVVLGMLSRAHMANDNYDLAQVIRQEFDIQLERMARRLLPRQRGESPRMSTGREGNRSWLTW